MSYLSRLLVNKIERITSSSELHVFVIISKSHWAKSVSRSAQHISWNKRLKFSDLHSLMSLTESCKSRTQDIEQRAQTNVFKTPEKKTMQDTDVGQQFTRQIVIRKISHVFSLCFSLCLYCHWTNKRWIGLYKTKWQKKECHHHCDERTFSFK